MTPPKVKIDDKKKVKLPQTEIPEFDIETEDLDQRENTMCACSDSDDNPYQ